LVSNQFSGGVFQLINLFGNSYIQNCFFKNITSNNGAVFSVLGDNRDIFISECLSENSYAFKGGFLYVDNSFRNNKIEITESLFVENRGI
jgi:hypothetical protein